MLIIRTVLSFLTCLLLAACTTPGGGRGAPETSPYYAPPAGSRVILSRPLTVRPGHARAFIQDGTALPGLPNEYQVSCNFELRYLSDAPQTIEPDSFNVIRVSRGFESVVALPRKPGLWPVGLRWDDSPSDIMHFIHMRLESARQPDVMRLTCRGILNMPSTAVPPSIRQIRTQLGDLVRLELAH